jgi:hypothetical protein
VASGDVGSFAPLTLGRTNLDVGQVDVTIEKNLKSHVDFHGCHGR